jgi:putative hydrolase of the HAD superfamily
VVQLSEARFGAVVFDLFGTLVPEFSRDEFYGTVRTMAVALDADPASFEAAWNVSSLERQTGVFATVEENVRWICASLGVESSNDAVKRVLDMRLGLYRESFHPRVGALETLAELKARGYPIALISMCAPDAPAMWRASALAPYVDVEVFSSEVGLRKPDPAIYRLATDRLRVAPDACVYCGDGAYGELAGAQAVGMTAYLIADPTVDPEASLTPERGDWDGARVADLRELLALLPGLG